MQIFALLSIMTIVLVAATVITALDSRQKRGHDDRDYS